MPSIRENLQHTMTANIIQPAQRGVDALGAAQQALELSQGLFEHVVGSEKESDLQQSTDYMSLANQRLTEALDMLARISEKMHGIAEKIDITVPSLRSPLPSPVPLIIRTSLAEGGTTAASLSTYVGDGPLDIIRDIVITHTDRNPADNTAIVSTMRQALDELGADHGTFSDELINMFDPHTEQSAVTAQTITAIDGLGALILDESTPRGARWGALALLGAVTLAEQPDQADQLRVDPGNVHARLTHHLARQALAAVVQADTLDESYRVSAHALLSQEGFPHEDVAVDLEVSGFREYRQLADEVPGAQDSNDDILEEAPIMGASIGDVYQESIFSFGPEVQAKIKAMGWVRLSDDAIGDVRDIRHDGVTIARVIDLTTTHSLLGSLKEQLENHHKLGQQFWPHLATNIIHFMKRQKLNRVSAAKIPTFYMRNLNTASENIVRAYYAPLGKDETGVLILGLVAAFHTKKYQREVLSIITEGDGRALTRRGRRQ